MMRHRKLQQRPSWGQVLLVLVAIAIIATGVWLQWLRAPVSIDPNLSDSSDPARTERLTPSPSVSTAPSPTTTSTSSPKPEPHCSRGEVASPSAVHVSGQWYTVEQLAPAEDGTAPVPSGVSPSVFAWDKTSAKAGGNGSGIMTAHTYQDGSALGNVLIRSLRLGDVLKVRGVNGSLHCYQISEQRFVPLADTSAVSSALDKMYRSSHDQLVIYVCDGLRRGPGDWSARSVWFATPVK